MSHGKEQVSLCVFGTLHFISVILSYLRSDNKIFEFCIRNDDNNKGSRYNTCCSLFFLLYTLYTLVSLFLKASDNT